MAETEHQQRPAEFSTHPAWHHESTLPHSAEAMGAAISYRHSPSITLQIDGKQVMVSRSTAEHLYRQLRPVVENQ